MENQQAVNALDGLAQAMLASVQPQIDAAIEREIEAQKAKIGVRKIEIVQAGEVKAKMNGRTHPMFEKVLRLVSAGIAPLLVGPAGCGKTKLASDIARALKSPFGAISGSGGATESQLIGRLLPTGEAGKFEYHSSPFVKLYETGGLFLFDEVDAFDPNMLLVLNQATANGGFFVEARTDSPYVKRHEAAHIIASANTYGTGSGALYVGRNALDAAFLDRFYVVEMDYDRELEAEIGHSQVVSWVWQKRDAIKASKLRRVMSTRTIQKMTAAFEAGLDMAEIKRDILAGYSPDELAKIGETI